MSGEGDRAGACGESDCAGASGESDFARASGKGDRVCDVSVSSSVSAR